MKSSVTRSLVRGVLLASLGFIATSPAQSSFSQRWRSKVKAFERENARLDREDNVVLLGSSSMEGWRYSKRVDKYLPNIKERVLNRGISGDGRR